MPAKTINKKIPVARPWMDEREAAAARRAILSGWVTQGPEVAAFEKEFADYVGAPHACAVSSCTAALHMALQVLGVRSGDEVITVSHTFIATVNSIRYGGAVPVFVDIQPDTFNMDPMLIEKSITPRTRAILCVHQMGMPCDLRAIMAVARCHSLAVIEDAACAIGSEIRWEKRWEKIGKPHGDIACFSFHPRKVITTGDGGMLTTAHAQWDAQFRLLRQHGMSIPDTARHAAAKVVFESYAVPGYNYRMTDIQAAVGREQLKRLPAILEHRRRLARRYAQLLQAHPRIRVPLEPDWDRSNWQSYCVRLPMECDQKNVMQRLLDQGVATRRGVMCCHCEAACRDIPVLQPLPESERTQDKCLVLPLWVPMSDDDQDYVVNALLRAVDEQ